MVSMVSKRSNEDYLSLCIASRYVEFVVTVFDRLKKLTIQNASRRATAGNKRKSRVSPNVNIAVASYKLAVSSCILSVGSCKLAVSSCILSVGSCKLAVSSCILAVSSCKLAVSSCKLAVSSCKLAVSSYKLAVNSYKLTVASCKLAVGSFMLTISQGNSYRVCPLRIRHPQLHWGLCTGQPHGLVMVNLK